MESLRYKLTIAYDGALFHGWQKQEPPGEEPLRTVQGVIIEAMQRLLAQPINLVGASRTDARVHAIGQVAHFDAASRVPVERMAGAITGRLPEDIDIIKAEVVDRSFDAITDAKNKQYRYSLHHTRRRPLGQRHAVYHCWTPLDIDRMNDAAARLVGTHDVEGLSAAGHGRTSTIRTIYDCHVETKDDQVQIVVQGSGFLYNMVRIIAGTLVEVGRGRFEPSVIDRILATADRREAGPTLPAEGLCLEWIAY